MGEERETGAGRLAGWIAAPQALVLVFVAVTAAMAGFGWSLVVLLAGALALSALAAVLVWRTLLWRRDPPGLFRGALVGAVAGIAAAALSFGALAADKHVAPRFGGSLLDALARPVIETGVRTGFDAYATKTPIDVLTTPHRAFTAFAGGMLAVMLVAGVTLAIVALPILTGLLGGVAAAWRASRWHKRNRLCFEDEPV